MHVAAQQLVYRFLRTRRKRFARLVVCRKALRRGNPFARNERKNVELFATIQPFDAFPPARKAGESAREKVSRIAAEPIRKRLDRSFVLHAVQLAQGP